MAHLATPGSRFGRRVGTWAMKSVLSGSFEWALGLSASIWSGAPNTMYIVSGWQCVRQRYHLLVVAVEAANPEFFHVHCGVLRAGCIDFLADYSIVGPQNNAHVFLPAIS